MGRFPITIPIRFRPENLRDLEAVMRREPFALGVAFDGDADRAFFIDDKVRPLPGSTVTAMLARWFLHREPGARIVHNLICSRAVPETIQAHGGIPVRTRVGHSYIKSVMAETKAVFGGEHSGHYYFRDNYRADSGVLALLVLLRLMSEDGRPLSEIRTEYERYAQSGRSTSRSPTRKRRLRGSLKCSQAIRICSTDSRCRSGIGGSISVPRIPNPCSVSTSRHPMLPQWPLWSTRCQRR